MLTHIDLFTGIGGFSIAASMAGFDTILHSEIDPYCQALLRLRFPGVPLIGDVRELEELCQEYVHIAGYERFLRVTQDVNLAIQRLLGNGEIKTKNSAAPMIENITGEENRRLSTIMGEDVPVVGSMESSSFVSIIKTIMVMRKENNIITHQYGKSLLKEDCPTTTKFSAITATTQRRCMGYVHIKTINLLSAGIPCQPASVAGKRRGKADDRWLWPSAITLLKYLNPDWAVFENPAGIGSLGELGGLSEMGDDPAQTVGDWEAAELDNILGDIEAHGYEVQPVLIPACAVGAPHKRDRIFIIAHNTDSPLFGREALRAEPDGQRGEGDKPAADSDSRPRLPGNGDEAERGGRDSREVSGRGASNAPDSKVQGLEGEITEGRERSGGRFTQRDWERDWAEVAAELCRVDDGRPAELDGLKLSKSKHRELRLKALGNMVSPEQVYPILKAIADYERGRCR